MDGKKDGETQSPITRRCIPRPSAQIFSTTVSLCLRGADPAGYLMYQGHPLHLERDSSCNYCRCNGKYGKMVNV